MKFKMLLESDRGRIYIAWWSATAWKVRIDRVNTEDAEMACRLAEWAMLREHACGRGAVMS